MALSGKRQSVAFRFDLYPVFVWTGATVYVQQRFHGGTFVQAWYAWTIRVNKRGPGPVEILLALVIQAGLLWFTFASNSGIVTEGDKCAVRWIMAGAMLAWLAVGFRYVLGLY